ncbi:MAG: hypothetical protein A2X12_05630 [Bacteroidetes bacterium GWE2_29_8]|nr:MAG: hypothetical protein A2X12_05630 [Bacteroidetes bacterium GWE2_29_8]OFY23763.1 MAG: hypothetical protein A2X02_03580 [Bacteroidetes bacterium GWF2_29_10]
MYIHTDIFAVQSSKKIDQPCGDAYGTFRDEVATNIVLADGLGSGIKAHIAANMCVSRIIGLIRMGMSLRDVFKAVSSTMDKAWGTGAPFSVFTIARILNNGQTTILIYEMPPPLLVNKNHAQLLPTRIYTQGKAIVRESNCIIDKGEGLLLLSDGITQSGIGKYFTSGWDVDGVKSFLLSYLPRERVDGSTITRLVHDQAKSYWPEGKGDDCSVILALNRRGVIVNLLSGPPFMKSDDVDWVNHFMQTEGIHIISGGSTAMITAKINNKQLEVNKSENHITPPSYKLNGIELVTEGMVTLNQVFHLLDEDPDKYPQDSPASNLAYFLKVADRVNIWLGKAENLNEGSIEFKQQGLLNRGKIIKKIIEKLREQGKLVVVNEK